MTDAIVTRPGLTPDPLLNGPGHERMFTYWPDGITTCVLSWRGGHIVQLIADEADTVIGAMEALRSGEEMSRDRLAYALRDTRRLMLRLTAVQEELMLYAREEGADGEPRMTWKEIGDEVGQHLTSVRERHQRAATGHGAAWRNWLVQETPRARMYPTDGRPAVVTGTVEPAEDSAWDID
jgi:hypothetical protein